MSITEIGEFYNRKKEEITNLRTVMRRVFHANYDEGSPLGTVLRNDKVIIREDDYKTICNGIDNYIQLIEKRLSEEP